MPTQDPWHTVCVSVSVSVYVGGGYIKHHHEHIVSLFRSISDTFKGGFSSLPSGTTGSSLRRLDVKFFPRWSDQRCSAVTANNKGQLQFGARSPKHAPLSWTLRCCCGAAARLRESSSPWMRVPAAGARPRLSLNRRSAVVCESRLLPVEHSALSEIHLKHATRGGLRGDKRWRIHILCVWWILTAAAKLIQDQDTRWKPPAFNELHRKKANHSIKCYF